MDSTAICAKFGLDYLVTERTFTMGIDRRFAAEMARRFCGRSVLETCTGGGFTTIALARVAAHVVTVEVEPAHQVQAKHNLAMAGLADRVMFVLADIMDEKTWNRLPPVDAAFLDPDWAVIGPAHVHRFANSSTQPPADALLDRTLSATQTWLWSSLPPSTFPSSTVSRLTNARSSIWIRATSSIACTLVNSPSHWVIPNSEYDMACGSVDYDLWTFAGFVDGFPEEELCILGNAEKPS